MDSSINYRYNTDVRAYVPTLLQSEVCDQFKTKHRPTLALDVLEKARHLASFIQASNQDDEFKIQVLAIRAKLAQKLSAEPSEKQVSAKVLSLATYVIVHLNTIFYRRITSTVVSRFKKLLFSQILLKDQTIQAIPTESRSLHLIVLKILGIGSYNTASLVYDITEKRECVYRELKIKWHYKDASWLDDIHYHQKLLGLKIPGILRIYSIVNSRTPTGSHKGMLVKYYKNGALSNVVRSKLLTTPLTEDQSMSILVQLVTTVAAMHSHHILHGDLKPENILYKRGKDGSIKIKLCDFGFTREFSKWDFKRYGALLYQAPELWKLSNTPPENPLPALDAWAVGLIAYELRRQGEDFQSYHDMLLRASKHKTPYSYEVLDTLLQQLPDNPYSQFTKNLLAEDPANRWSLETALAYLNEVKVPLENL